MVAYTMGGRIRLQPTAGGRMQPLTQGPYDRLPLWSPANDGTLVFLRANVEWKGQPAQVFRSTTRSGPIRIGRDTGMSLTHVHFVPTGKALSFMAPAPDHAEEKKRKETVRVYPRDEEVARLWSLSLRSGRVRALSPPDLPVWEYDWFPDGRSAAVIVSRDRRRDAYARHYRSSLGILRGGRLSLLTLPPTGGRFGLRVSPDGTHIAFLYSPLIAALGGSAWSVHVDSGRTVCLMPAENAHVEALEWLPDGSGLVLLVAEGVDTRLYTVTLDAPGKLQRIGNDIPCSTHQGFQVSGDGVVAVSEGPRTAPELWYVSLRGTRSTRLSSVNQRQTRTLRWARRKVVRWRSAGRISIEGILTLPPASRRDRRYPTVVVIHGGPCSRFKLLSGLVQQEVMSAQLLAAQGYAVLEPNIRGSTGYGDGFLLSNVRDWGGADFKDIMTGLDHLIQQGIADPDRLAIYGASYGGFMVNWAVTQTDRFKAAVSLCGSSHHLSKYYISDICPDFMDRYFGKPSRKQRELFWDRSPIAHVRCPKTPILILHGEEDPRVPVSQSYQMYRALLQAGAETELVIYPTRGHGLGTPDAFKRALDWLDRHLKTRDTS